MPQYVLPVLRGHVNHRLTVGADHGMSGKVAHIGEQAAPLRSEQVNQVQTFGARLEQRGLRRQKMNVRIGRNPAARAEVGDPRHLCAEFGAFRATDTQLGRRAGGRSLPWRQLRHVQGQLRNRPERDVRLFR